ncbi:MAG: GDP-mannose 4,6-dehydratase [Nanobdellota archaeon]
MVKHTVLLTGVAGFIGSSVAKRLVDKGYSVVGIDNMNDYYDVSLKQARLDEVVPDSVEFVKGDILDYGLLKELASKHSFDGVIHLAAQAGVRYSLDHPDTYIQTNIQGTNNIFELAKEFDIPKVVFASSSSVYGGNKKVPFSEDDDVSSPVSLYAASKKSNELQAEVYNHLYSISMVGLRFFTVYGPWGRPDMAAFKFLKRMFAGDAIDVYNHGDMERDFTFIDDIVDGVVKSLEYDCDGVEVFNLGNHNPEKLLRFIELLETHSGETASKNMMPMQPGDVPKTFADTSKANGLLGWRAKTGLDAGLKEFVEWYRRFYGV